MKRTLPSLAFSSLLLLAAGCGGAEAPRGEPAEAPEAAASPSTAPDPASGAAAEAIFAGGCFWCMEPPFDELEGVHATISGYIGGSQEDPTYKEVSRGGTGHTEAVRVSYDPEQIDYEELLEVFWRNIDPTVEDRQFCDWGDQYRTGIFYLDETQKELAEASKQEIVDSGRFERVVTEITAASTFYPAEEYHQDYYTKNPLHYKQYRRGCGRDRRLEELWGA